MKQITNQTTSKHLSASTLSTSSFYAYTQDIKTANQYQFILSKQSATSTDHELTI